jgi:hypothetical protein
MFEHLSTIQVEQDLLHLLICSLVLRHDALRASAYSSLNAMHKRGS